MILKDHYDVIIAGGGIAGIGASVRAAREGVSVLLIERYGFLGGMATAGMVSPFMKHDIGGKPLVCGVFSEIEENMRKYDGMLDNGFYADAFRLASFTMLMDSGVTILFHAEIYRVNRSENKLCSLSVLLDGQEKTLSADIFIDTTGDAQLLYLGNFPWAKGDETTGHLQAMTLFFRMAGIDIHKATEYVKAHPEDFFSWMTYDFDFSRIISVAGYFSHVKRAIAEKRLPEEVRYIFFTTLPESGEASFNTSNILAMDGSSSYSLTKAELAGHKQISAIVRLLQEEIPGFENSLLLETAIQTGIRETRRAVGDVVMSEEDILQCRKFPDAIARGCYGIDIHAQKGEEDRLDEMPQGEYYEVPLRCLLVRGAENLLAAGRCISATRKAHGALRIMPTCCATGEACGALASLAARQKITLRQVDFENVQRIVQHNLK